MIMRENSDRSLLNLLPFGISNVLNGIFDLPDKKKFVLFPWNQVLINGLLVLVDGQKVRPRDRTMKNCHRKDWTLYQKPMIY